MSRSFYTKVWHYIETPSSVMHAYRITTDQKTFDVRAYWLDYKKTVQDLRAKGYTGINIAYLGRAL